MAVSDTLSAILQPGEQALVPVVWSQKVGPGTFRCRQPSEPQHPDLEVMEGVFDGVENERMMIVVENVGCDSIVIEKGDSLAAADLLPPMTEAIATELEARFPRADYVRSYVDSDHAAVLHDLAAPAALQGIPSRGTHA